MSASLSDLPVKTIAAPSMSGRPTYGRVIRAASDLAAHGATSAEIRAALAPIHGDSAVTQAICRLRLRGQLPERELRQPTVFHLDVGDGPALRIREIAVEAGVPRATIARRALLLGLRKMLGDLS